MQEGSDIEAVMSKMRSIGDEEFQSRFFQDDKCIAKIFVNGIIADLKTDVKDKDTISLVPYLGGG